MLNTALDSMTSTRVVHVSVAVIVKNGQVLVSKRAEHVHQGGLWEFPGGKVEQDESIEAALYREVQEELGMDIKSSRPLISVLHHYPDKSVLLDTRLVTAFSGREYSQAMAQPGLEGQMVRWLDIDELANYQFPSANQAIINALQLPEHYAITPDILISRGSEPGNSKPAQTDIEQFLQDFAKTIRQQRLLQLRVKSLTGEPLNQLVRQACILAQQSHTRVLLNSAMPVSKDLYKLANGIHLTSQHLHDSHFADSFQKQYPEKLIAASCHNRDDVERANQLQVDFIVISPVQRTASHPDQVPLGWVQFKALSDIASVPVFALGGMTGESMVTAQANGAQGIAAIRGLWTSGCVKR